MRISPLIWMYINTMVILSITVGFSIQSQGPTQWLPAQTIPGYDPDTWPPVLVADRNRTVHAFSSQWLNRSDGTLVRAVMYNQWNIDNGWTLPIDILLSPNKNDAQIMDAHLDRNGIVHVLFLGGDNTDANLYYSYAPLVNAGNSNAWSPVTLIAENVQDPGNAVFWDNDSGALSGILFSGRKPANGLYGIYTDDGGNNWSQPELIYPMIENYINDLQLIKGASGRLHVVWNEITIAAQGRGIYYTSSALGDYKWKFPIKLEEANIGFGTQTPAIIEYQKVLYAFYNVGGSVGIVMRSSENDGNSWSDATKLFSRHVGVNGSLSPVVDGNDQLHLFFGQRITGTMGNPDIHGMWHSIWQGDHWSEPEAVVSGPQVIDRVGYKGFDPLEAKAVVSQGNLILVTWRTEAQSKGNGVWYSFKKIDAAEEPVETLPSPSIQKLATDSPITTTPMPLATISPISTLVDPLILQSLQHNPPANSNNQTLEIMTGILPAAIFLTAVLIYKSIRNRK